MGNLTQQQPIDLESLKSKWQLYSAQLDSASIIEENSFIKLKKNIRQFMVISLVKKIILFIIYSAVLLLVLFNYQLFVVDYKYFITYLIISIVFFVFFIEDEFVVKKLLKIDINKNDIITYYKAISRLRIINLKKEYLFLLLILPLSIISLPITLSLVYPENFPVLFESYAFGIISSIVLSIFSILFGMYVYFKNSIKIRSIQQFIYQL